jgi:DNA-directed RNA polymerase subunit RPC12/RpoP
VREGYRCRKCWDWHTIEDLDEFRAWGDSFWLDRKTRSYICPDCWDTFIRKDLEDQFEDLMSGMLDVKEERLRK